MARRVPPIAAAGGLPLAGCAPEGADLLTLGVAGVLGLFLASLFVAPWLHARLSRRQHHERMYNRLPFRREHPDAPHRPRRQRRSKG